MEDNDEKDKQPEPTPAPAPAPTGPSDAEPLDESDDGSSGGDPQGPGK